MPIAAPQAPLAERMRPQQLDQILGQAHLLAPGTALRRAIEGGRLPSLLLWGPPGVGKTTMAVIMARQLNLPFFQLSAISSGVKDIREVIEQAQHQKGVVLFIDEIHRFNKSQQDALLGAVEKGIITLIGATTENPSFEVNGALLSRCQVYVLQPLSQNHLLEMLQHAIKTDVWLQQFSIVLSETEALVRLSGGDARKLLNLLELSVVVLAKKTPAAPINITDQVVVEAAQRPVVLYDKSGEQHYDIVSAFIKSIRGSDPNGAVYWLARMIAGGEDIAFIARRMLILASEDIGNANPTALVMANACFDAVKKIGYPEGRIILSQCATYLAASPKSNAAYMAIEDALKLVEQHGNLPVPLHLRNAPTGLMKALDYGKDYQYSHLGQENFIAQEYLPQPLQNTLLYSPGKNAREEELRQFLRKRWQSKYGY
ncbi:MAG: replication-associated recombination protein A [Bacteroidetes bacterium]|nr:MAG: replication-associated recombination protein A [Bacteroidota bacterium]